MEIICFYFTFAQIYKQKGSTITFICQYTATSGNGLRWEYNSLCSDPWTVYSSNTDVTNVTAKPRITITGNFSSGKYDLNIKDLQESDKGCYKCRIGGGGIIGDPQQLVVIVGPTSVNIIGKTLLNKTEGTEGQTLHINCTATAGSPPPDVKLLVDGHQVKNGTQAVSYNTGTLKRSHDGQIVTCQAGYTSINDFNLTDTSELYLRLRPLVPTFTPASVSVIENEEFQIKCTTNGSRPEAVYHWEIGGANITSSSQIESSTLDPSSNTYKVVSHLTYTFTKDINSQELICKAISAAAPGGVSAVPIRVDVKYPPSVTVNVTKETPPTKLTCTADGNPDKYIFYRWTHESLQGTLIRTLPGNTDGTLTLPNVNSSLQYQNTGRYNCTVGNGIPDTATRRTGSSVLTVHAPPVCALYNSWIQGGEKGKSANISVNVYSIPSPASVVWYKGINIPVSEIGYSTSSTPTTVTVLFYGKKINVSGLKITLAIDQVKDSDFSTYKLLVNNSRGSIEQNITFISTSAPETPGNLDVIHQTENSLTVQWTAGYDGGYEQTFFIMYQQQGTETWTTLSGPKGVRGSSDKVHQMEISGLQHSTTYNIKMFAENQINKSAETMIFIGITGTKNEGTFTGAFIGGLAGGLTAVTILIVFVILKFRKKRENGKKSAPKRIKNTGSESDTEYELKDNIIYGMHRPESSQNSVPVYADVKKKPNVSTPDNHVYSEVKKTNKASKGKKKAKSTSKSDVVKNDYDSEYANSDHLPPQRFYNDEYANNEEVPGSSGGQKNADVLKYADLLFAKSSATGKLVIHGEERTVYSDIDHFQVGPEAPQRSAYEDITIGKPNHG